MTTATPNQTPTDEEPNSWHSVPIERVFEALDADEAGLTARTATARLDEYGHNEIRREGETSPLDLFLSQFQDFLIYILIFAALLSLGIGLLPGFEPHYTDAVLILLILLANGVFGFVQDYQAEKSIEALRELSSPGRPFSVTARKSRSTRRTSFRGTSSSSNRGTRSRRTPVSSRRAAWKRTNPHSPARARTSRRRWRS